MTFRRSALTVGIVMTLGFSLGNAKQAAANGGCGMANGYYGHPGHYGGSYAQSRAAPMPRAGYYGAMPHRAGWMGPHFPHPAMNYGVQPGKTVKTAKAAPEVAGPPDLLDTALASGSFNMLVAALQAAELADTLRSDGPFTVFAPTDAAFSKVPQKELDALLGDKEALASVLSYHVVPGKVLAADVAQMTSAETVQGSRVAIDTSEGVRVDGAEVVKADVLASNGVIHVIDTVIMPK